MIGGNDMINILVAGDSFASNWNTGEEWWQQLPYNITNIAQAGASQYKILKSFTSVDIKAYDAVIVFHTSPTRIYASKGNLLHKDSITHRDSCYVINDVLSKRGPIKRALESYTKYFYDDDFITYTHRKICHDIETKTHNVPVIHASGFDYTSVYTFKNFVSITDLFETHRGNICHLTPNGNRLLKERIYKQLQQLWA
jgi:hypothetical protein